MKFSMFSFQQTYKFLAVLIVSLIIYGVFKPKSIVLSSLYRFRLRPQNTSQFQRFNFRNLSALSDKCEQLGTVDCLHYLDTQQSQYLIPLSKQENEQFQKRYCTKKSAMLFHTYWNNPNTFDDPLLVLHIESFLFTQNRQCSRLIIWTIPPLIGDIDQRYNIHAPYLQFRSLTPLAKELRDVGVSIDSIISKLLGRPLLVRSAVVSDAIRFVALHKYGGIYVDADILALRDLQPFYSHEFSYRWSMLNEFNTAVINLNPQSKISGKLIELAKRRQDPWKFYPTKIRGYLDPLILQRVPSAFFDPLWLAADGVDRKAVQKWNLKEDGKKIFKMAFYKNNTFSQQGRNALRGAFLYHWHSLHDVKTFEQGSYLYKWKEYFETQLLEKTPLTQ